MLPFLAALAGPALASFAPAIAGAAAPALAGAGGASLATGLFNAAASGAGRGALSGLAGSTGFKMPDAVLQSGGSNLPTGGFQMPSMFSMGAPQGEQGGDAAPGAGVGSSVAANAARRSAMSADPGGADVGLGRSGGSYRAPAAFQTGFQPSSPMFGRKAAFYAGR